ncbi:MAG: hypothetical protein J6D01_03625 [Muribaculaceae bacterium]|nr:hypothetical protein [Muribaculaceae bacterium]
MKIKTFLASAISLILFIFSAPDIYAQLATGEWKFYNSYPPGDARQLAVNSDGKLYILAGINLFQFDPDTKETVQFTSSTGLNGIKISKIHYDRDMKLLAVAYSDGNMDFIHDDGRIFNQNGISTANLNGQRKIKCLTSGHGLFFVGTDFGIVVIDGKNFRVKETGQYNVKRAEGSATPIPFKGPDALEVMGNRLMAVFNMTEPDAETKDTSGKPLNPMPPHTSTGHLFESDITDTSKTYREADKFVFLCDITSDDIASVDNLHLASRRKDNNKVDFYEFPQTVNGTCIVNKDRDWGHQLQVGFWKADGLTYSFNADYRTLKLVGNSPSLAFTDTRDIKDIFAVAAGDTSADTWFATPEGLLCYDLTKDPIELKYDPYKVYAPSVTNVSNLTLSPDGNRIYVSTRSASLYKSASGNFTNTVPYEGNNDYGYYTPGYIDMIDNGIISPLVYTNDKLSYRSGVTGNVIGSGATRMAMKYYGNIVIAPNAVAVNPVNPSQLWIPTSNEGLYVMDNGRITAIFSGTSQDGADRILAQDNIPATAYSNQLMMDAKFDPQGNLWVLATNHRGNTNIGQTLMMLPAVYVNGDLSKVQKSDWIYKRSDGSYLIPEGFKTNWDGEIIPFRRSNVFVIKGSIYSGVVIYRHKGSYSNVEDDSYVVLDHVRDQDGNPINMQTVSAVVETPSGGLLISYEGGLLLVSDPATFDPAKQPVQRLKQPRNDGSGFADYLLNSVVVSDFAIDDAGRIWVATEGDGISVLQSDLRDIVATYNTDNSRLPTNYVSAIELDPHNNIVYFGTSYGLGAFASDQSPAMEDFNTVRAYPNPVRPDYYGVITIDGLMNDSLVKITDAQGNVIYTGESIGGMMTWDGTNFNGRRVPSGVYYVMASQDGQSDGPKGKVACKILVLK